MFLIISLLIGVSIQQTKYNILSLDSARYKGYITAAFVDHMENRAYNLSVEHCNMTARDSKKVAMHEIFDLVSGSETGAIIASTLALPNLNETTNIEQKNAYFANHTTQWFDNHVDELYKNHIMSGILKFLLTLCVIVLVSGNCYIHVEKHFDDENFDELVWELLFLLKLHKKDAKLATSHHENEE